MQSRTFKAAMLAMGNITNAIVSMASLALLVRVLPVSEYATYRQVLLTYVFVAPFLTFGLPEALYYFLPAASRAARSILLENLVVLGAAGALVGALLLVGGAQVLADVLGNAAAAEGLALMAAYPLLTLPTGSINAALISKGRTAHAAVYTVTSRLLFLGAIVGACVIWRTANAALVANLIAAALVLPFGLILALSACPGDARPTMRGAVKQVGYAIPVGIASVIAATTASADKLVVSRMASPADFAIYVNGAMEIPLVGVLTGSAMAVLLPEMSRLWKEGRAGDALAMWQRAATKTALGLFPAFVALLVLAPEVVTLLYSPKYAASASVFRIWVLLLPLRVVYFGAVLMAAGKAHVLLITSSVGLAANVALSVWLVGLIGYHGAAWAALGSMYLLQIPLTIHFIKRTYRVEYLDILPFRTLGRVAGISVAAGVVLVPAVAGFPENSFVRLTLYGAAYAVSVAGALAAADLIDIRRLWELARSRISTVASASDSPAAVRTPGERQ